MEVDTLQPHVQAAVHDVDRNLILLMASRHRARANPWNVHHDKERLMCIVVHAVSEIFKSCDTALENQSTI